jgi:hypothetical protein
MVPQTTRRTMKQQKKRPAGVRIDKHAKEVALNIVATRVETLRANSEGATAPYGAINTIIADLLPTFPWLSKSMVKYHLIKLNKQGNEDRRAFPTVTATSISCSLSSGRDSDRTSSTLSTLTAEDDSVSGSNGMEKVVLAGNDNDNEDEQEQHKTSGGNEAVLENESSPVPAENGEVGRQQQQQGIVVPQFGRPKGTTESSSREVDERTRLATIAAAKEYKAATEQRKDKHQQRLQRGTLKSIMARAKQTYNVQGHIRICESTIRSRCRRNCLQPLVRQGTPSPMLGIEPLLVEIIIQLARMRCPINVAAALRLANSLIAGTSIAEQLIKWKLRHNVQTRRAMLEMPGPSTADRTAVLDSTTMPANNEMDDKTPSVHSSVLSSTITPLLGSGYWQGFMKRNGHVITSKRAVKFEAKRAEWCTYDNFKCMYDGIYREMARGGIANELAKAVFLDKQGEIVETKEEAFGLPTKYMISRPDKLVFVDEVGSNTSTTKDGNVGGEKFLCEKMARPQIRAATKDSHFTVLGFTAATGEPVMCAIIFGAKELAVPWVLGYDASAEWQGNENEADLNTGGLGKMFPMGPQCNYNGVDIPCFCCCSENGSITANLLVEMLKAMDSLKVFDRSDGVSPFLLLDGHGSRFELPFLQYINNPLTHWNVCIGLPYGTSYWQVGDSSEQNGCFKMALTKYKRELLTRKELVGGEFAIEKEDVACLVSRAWQDSFARIRTNKNAIAERGWAPLNYNCLLHPEIAATRCQGADNNDGTMEETSGNSKNNELTVPSVPPDLLNLSHGYAGTLIDSIIETRNRNDARNGVNVEENRRKRKEKALENQRLKTRRFGSGNLYAEGQCAMGKDVLRRIEDRERLREEKRSQQQEKKLREYRLLRNKVMAIKQLGQPHEQLNVAQLKTMVMWYKHPSDSPIPTTRQLLLERLHQTCHRVEPEEPAIPFLVVPHQEPMHLHLQEPDEGEEQEP